MALFGFSQRVAVLGAPATAAMVMAAITSAQASVISDTPTLPLLNVPHVTNSDACFPTAGVCISDASIILTRPVSSFFDAVGQHITTNAHQTATLTNLSHAPIGSVNLFGTVEQEVLGRTFSTGLGSWTTNLISLSLSGSVLGHTLSVVLDPANQPTGEASITSISGPNEQQLFRIESFFDVFSELSLDTTLPLKTTVGPIHVEAVLELPGVTAIPTGILMLLTMSRRHKTGLRKS